MGKKEKKYFLLGRPNLNLTKESKKISFRHDLVLFYLSCAFAPDYRTFRVYFLHISFCLPLFHGRPLSAFGLVTCRVAYYVESPV